LPPKQLTALLVVVPAIAMACGAEPRPAPSPAVVTVPAAPTPVASDAGAAGSRDDASASDAASVDDPRACLGKCRGRASADLGPALQARAAEGRRCYNEALRTTPTLEGHTTVSLRVAADGSLCSATVKTSDMPAVVNDCLLGLFERQLYPAPSGGCLDAEVPLVFKRQVPQQGP
jgi:hypothetical protein